MKSRLFLAAPAVFALAAMACSAEVGSQSDESTGSASEAVSCSPVWGQCGGTGWTGATCCAAGSTCTYSQPYYSQCLPGSGGNNSNCPSVGTYDTQMRAAATAAYQILRAASLDCGTQALGPCWGTTVLSSQHYRVAASGTTIEFDPKGPLYYTAATIPAQAALAIAQLDSSVASFLVSALKWDQTSTNGQALAVLPPTAALMKFTPPGNNTAISIADFNANGGRQEVVTSSDWCGTQRIHFIDTAAKEAVFAPAVIQSWSGAFPGTSLSTLSSRYTGGSAFPATPFNGANSQNPYLVVSVNGSSLNWNSSSWPTMGCPNDGSCNGTLDIDPIPYTQPGNQYDANGNQLGPQANPFSLVITNLYADPSHQNQWATRTLNGVQQWGTFTTPVNVLGTTVYQYVKQM